MALVQHDWCPSTKGTSGFSTDMHRGGRSEEGATGRRRPREGGMQGCSHKPGNTKDRQQPQKRRAWSRFCPTALSRNHPADTLILDF